MRMNWLFLKVLALGLLGIAPVGEAWARSPDVQAASAKGDYYSILVAERRVTRLPAGPLYWKIERFPTLQAAERAPVSSYALIASIADRHWLFTLGARGAAAHGGTAVAEIGPIEAPRAKAYLLRVSHAGGPAGSRTAAYKRVGSEATYVLSGQISQRTPRGMVAAAAGAVLNGAPEVTTQTMSSGAADLEQIMLSVLDVDRLSQDALAVAAKPVKAGRGDPRSKGRRPILPPIVRDAPEPPAITPPPVEPPPAPPPEPVRLIPAPTHKR
jgi:hypothetical protein